MATLALKVSFDKIYIQHSIRFVLCVRQNLVNFVLPIRKNVILRSGQLCFPTNFKAIFQTLAIPDSFLNIHFPTFITSIVLLSKFI